MSIKQRTGIPGGACEFDLPSFHYWLHRPAEERMDQLADWTGPLYPLRDGTAIILRILRESGKPQTASAALGTYQQMLGGKSAHMMRVRLAEDVPCVPEISANKYVLNVRWQKPRKTVPIAVGQQRRLDDLEVQSRFKYCDRYRS